MNVAVTRARRHLTVVCDSTTVSSHDFIQSLVDHAHRVGNVISAQEWIDQGLVNAGGLTGSGGGSANCRVKGSGGGKGGDKSVDSQPKKTKNFDSKRNEPNAAAIADSLLPLSSVRHALSFIVFH